MYSEEAKHPWGAGASRQGGLKDRWDDGGEF